MFTHSNGDKLSFQTHPSIWWIHIVDDQSPVSQIPLFMVQSYNQFMKYLIHFRHWLYKSPFFGLLW